MAVMTFQWHTVTINKGGMMVMTLLRHNWRVNKDDTIDVILAYHGNDKSQYWPRGASKHSKTAENEKA